MKIYVDVVRGDITKSCSDAIVNAANPSLLGGGGVDGAIHRAAGPRLQEACRRLNGCMVGDVKITPGFNLRASYIVHTAGPVWQGGGNGESELLADSYRNSLLVADAHRCRTVDFPSISTGVYGFPLFKAAPIAVRTLMSTMRECDYVRRVRIVAFDADTYQTFAAAIAANAEMAV